MDCTSNGSATLKQDDGHNADDVQQQINKQGEDEQQQVKQMGITTMMVVNKGKRTKRQRLHNSDMSPIPSSSTNDHVVDEDDEEEQLDMAKCLILLAQGQSRPSSSYSPPPPASIPCDKSGQLSGSKRRRSYRSSSLSLGLSAGVYECKTCNKTFPSFQALGGHRTSHKKLNAATTSYQDYFINPLSLQLGNINYSSAEAPPIPNSIPTTSAVVNAQTANINNNKKSMNKIHECTICGAEFSSGQALGGHMRRHRGSVVPLNSSTKPTTTYTIAANTTLSLSSSGSATAAGKVVDRISNNKDNFLSLDLNMPLPASPSPEVDTKFSLHPKQQSGAMVFSTTPALVDCFH